MMIKPLGGCESTLLCGNIEENIYEKYDPISENTGQLKFEVFFNAVCMMYILISKSILSFFIFLSKSRFLLIDIILKNLVFLQNYTFFCINVPNYLNSVLISSVN